MAGAYTPVTNLNTFWKLVEKFHRRGELSRQEVTDFYRAANDAKKFYVEQERAGAVTARRQVEAIDREMKKVEKWLNGGPQKTVAVRSVDQTPQILEQGIW